MHHHSLSGKEVAIKDGQINKQVFSFALRYVWSLSLTLPMDNGSD